MFFRQYNVLVNWVLNVYMYYTGERVYTLILNVSDAYFLDDIELSIDLCTTYEIGRE